MSDEQGTGRRGFLRQVAAVAGTASLAPALLPLAEAKAAPTPAPTPAPAEPALPPVDPTYLSLGPDEAMFVEALVEVMCPADEHTPGGVECGLAYFMDRQLAGAFGAGERIYMRGPWKKGKPQLGYQSPMTPAAFFKAGIAAADAEAKKRFARSFAELSAAEADGLLKDIAGGKVDNEGAPLKQWFDEVVYPLFTQACFADPIYGGNRGKVFWKLVGYPGLPAFYLADMERYRGKPHPIVSKPKSISEFT
jgi:gluconate 2-dehydrogenase gamma chain